MACNTEYGHIEAQIRYMYIINGPNLTVVRTCQEGPLTAQSKKPSGLFPVKEV